MLDSVLGMLGENSGLIVGGGGSAIVLWVLKKIPNKELYSWVESAAYWSGTVCTLGLSKWKLTRKLWNSTIEPYFIDLLENSFGAALKGLLKGLRSDN